MIERRDFLIGAMCLVSAAGAEALRPRRRLILLGNAKLDKLIPKRIGDWVEKPTEAIVVPQTEDSLATKLYSQIVGRLYVRGDDYVMVLIAYGDTQNDLLQLHRPETCYPAFGFRLSDNRSEQIDIGHQVRVPGRALTATLNDRTEHILYWTRLGEYLPKSNVEQRMAKLETQFSGIVPDGVLVRISNNADDPRKGFALNQEFAADMLAVLPARYRAALVGSEKAALYNRGAGPVPLRANG